MSDTTATAATGNPGSDEPSTDGSAELARRSLPAGPDLLRDLAAVVVLLWPLLWLADNDGGRIVWPMTQFVLCAIPAAVLLWSEVRHWPTIARGLTWAVPLGALVAFAFAIERGAWVEEAQVFATMPVLALAASRLWRRPHGPAVLLGLLVACFAVWSWGAGLRWWGWVQLDVQPRWEFVSWRNQSGIMSAAFGMAALGLVLVGRRSVPIVATIVCGVAFGGAYLSSSRGALAVAAVGMGFATLLAARSLSSLDVRSLTSLAGRVAAVVVAATVFVVAMETTLPGGTASPIDSREQGLGQNSVARTWHWEAAVGMFLDRPVTGTGIGSYGGVAIRYTRDEANLTASAHNEWLEAFAEGGLVFGLPMALLLGATLVGAWRTGRRANGTEEGDPDGIELPTDALGIRRGATIGMAAMAVTVALHAGIDFDLRYASVAALFAVGAGAVAAVHGSSSSSEPAGARLWLPLVPVLGLVVLAAWGGSVQSSSNRAAPDLTAEQLATFAAPWDTSRSTMTIARLTRGGDEALALQAAERLAAWNPGNPRAQMTLARTQYLNGDIDAQELVARLEPPPTWISEWSTTAIFLLQQDERDAAERVAQAVVDFDDEWPNKSSGRIRLDALGVLMQLAIDEGDCRQVDDLAERALAAANGDEETEQAIRDAAAQCG